MELTKLIVIAYRILRQDLARIEMLKRFLDLLTESEYQELKDKKIIVLKKRTHFTEIGIDAETVKNVYFWYCEKYGLSAEYIELYINAIEKGTV